MPTYQHVVLSTGNPNDGISDTEEWRPLTEAGPYTLESGQATMSRTLETNSVALSSGTLRLAYFDGVRDETVSQMRMHSITGYTGGTPTLIRLALYTVADNGDLTLVASTASDTLLFASSATAYNKALSATYRLTRGQRYAAGALCVTSFTAPLVGCAPLMAITSDTLVNPPICGAVTGQTDLVSSYAVASVVVSPARIYIALLP